MILNEREDVLRRIREQKVFYSLILCMCVDHDVLKKVKSYLNGKDQESCLIILSISFMYFMLYAILFKISQDLRACSTRDDKEELVLMQK